MPAMLFPDGPNKQTHRGHGPLLQNRVASPPTARRQLTMASELIPTEKPGNSFYTEQADRSRDSPPEHEHPPMATDLDFITFVYEQIRTAGQIRYRKMFGEYAVYCDEKVVALACDNQLFVRPTAAAAAVLGEYREGPPYPGAKLHVLIDTQLEESELLTELIRATAALTPLPKPKKPKKPKQPKSTKTAAKPGAKPAPARRVAAKKAPTKAAAKSSRAPATKLPKPKPPASKPTARATRPSRTR